MIMILKMFIITMMMDGGVQCGVVNPWSGFKINYYDTVDELLTIMLLNTMMMMMIMLMTKMMIIMLYSAVLLIPAGVVANPLPAGTWDTQGLSSTVFVYLLRKTFCI